MQYCDHRDIVWASFHQLDKKRKAPGKDEPNFVTLLDSPLELEQNSLSKVINIVGTYPVVSMKSYLSVIGSL